MILFSFEDSYMLDRSIGNTKKEGMLLANANEALHQAKQGRNPCQIYRGQI
jgi:hypothetical protein